MNVYIRELARELGRSHLTIDIFTRRTQPEQPTIVSLSPHVRVIHIEAGPPVAVDKHDLPGLLPTFALQVEQFARRERRAYRIIHSHYWLSGMVGQQLARRWQVPHITMFHTLAHLKQLANPAEAEPPVRLEGERQLIQQVNRIIATTSDECTQLVRHCGATPGRIEVIPCGVDLRRFVPRDRWEARVQLGFKPDQPVLLFVGRLDPFKGPDVFLKAAALMKKQAHLVVVGGQLTGEDAALTALRQLAHALGIQERVTFLGARPQEELPLLYSAADATVVPSYHESFGLAAVESLACGTPVVATRAGGLMTVVHQDETGYLVARCPGFFAERLDFLIQHPEVQERMARTARSSVLQYSWQSVAARVSALYEDAWLDMEAQEEAIEGLRMVVPDASLCLQRYNW